jgi:hypothetical protein
MSFITYIIKSLLSLILTATLFILLLCGILFIQQHEEEIKKFFEETKYRIYQTEQKAYDTYKKINIKDIINNYQQKQNNKNVFLQKDNIDEMKENNYYPPSSLH